MIDRRKLEEILEECLAAYETGLTPEECLSAWPEHRDDLEPLLRQALMLRVSYSATPAPEFRARARESLLFNAGRDMKTALAAEPAPDFVMRTRNKFLYAAGASTQEALRDVPPPRLTFWMNARRRLVEAASSPTLQPQPARSGVASWRMGLSAAVVALAMTLAGLAYFTTQINQPGSVNAELAAIEQQLNQIELQASGTIPSDVLIDLISRTTSLALKLNPADQNQTQVADKLAEIIDRQYAVVDRNIATTGAPSTALQQAKQQLEVAEDKVRVLASRSDTPILQSTIDTQPAAQAEVPTLAPATPTAAAPTPRPATPQPAPTLAPLTGNQIRITLLSNDQTFGLFWREVQTAELRFVIPLGWQAIGITGIAPDGTGQGTIEGSNFVLVGPNNVIVIIGLKDGSVQAMISDVRHILREDGRDGDVMSVEELVRIASPAGVVLELRYLTESVTFLLPATPTPSGTPSPTSTP